MLTVDTPEIIDQHIQHTQQCDKKHCRVFCFESNRNHDTCKKSEYTERNTTSIPTISPENKAKEKEDQKNTSSELEISPICRGGIRKFRKSCKCDFTTM